MVSCSGPRKPQRHSTFSFGCSNLPGDCDNSSVAQKYSIADNTPSTDLQNKLLMETSFGNNYLEVGNNRSYYPICPSSSKTSSIAGSILKNNQTFDMHSLSTSERGRSPSVPSDATTVIFADDITNNRLGKTSNSFQCLNDDLHQKYMFEHTYNSNNKNDYEAPLASPETLSEISSISSENVLNNLRDSSCDSELNSFIDSNLTVFESQLHTPKVMRRALKFTENLSLCANDKRNIDQYKRLGRVFLTNPLKMMQSTDNQSFSSKDSYDTDSIQLRPFENSKSADNIDNEIEKPTFYNKLTFSDSTCINEMQDCLGQQIKQFSSTMDSKHKLSSNETFYSANSSKSSIDKMSTIKYKTNEHTVQNQETGILESHFPVYTTDTFCENDERLYSNKTSNGKVNNKSSSPNSIHSRKIYQNNEKMFLLNESLPLLSNLSEKNRPTQKFCKRKGCVYPETLTGSTNPNVRPLSKSESNV